MWTADNRPRYNRDKLRQRLSVRPGTSGDFMSRMNRLSGGPS